MKLNKYLPIGSVVLLKNARKKVMIVGLLQKIDNNETIYDYSACVYPVGIINSGNMIAFNHDDIELIHSLGYQDDEFFELTEKISKKSI